MPLFMRFVLFGIVFLIIRYIIKVITIRFAFPYKHAVRNQKFYVTPQNVPYRHVHTPTHSYLSIINDPKRDENTNTIIFLHGNGKTVHSLYKDWKYISQKTNTNVYLIEYPGYDGTQHKYITEDMIEQSVLLSFERIMKKNYKTKVHIMGHSVGTGVAAYLHSANQRYLNPYHIRGIGLFSPYESLLRTQIEGLLWYLIMPFDSFRTVENLMNYSGFLYIVYSEQDEVIPPIHSKRFINRHSAEFDVFVGSHASLDVEQKLKFVTNFLAKCDKYNEGRTVFSTHGNLKISK